MAQNVPELQLLSDLRDKFPEVTPITIMKLMKMFNNDTGKCIQALEQESQRSMFGVGSSGPLPQTLDHNSHPTNHNNSANHTTSPAHINSGHRNSSPQIMSSPAAGSSPGVGGLSRYQELPVRHEQSSSMGAHHISTVQHTITPPSVLPKPEGGYQRPVMQPPARTDYRPMLVIDPANQGLPPPTAPVKPHDFAPFLETSARTRTEIPNIRCGPTGYAGDSGTGASSATGGSPSEQRRPVRVISVQGTFSGGVVTSRSITSPTRVTQGPQFRVLLGDGGGVCVSPAATVTSSVPSPAVSSSIFPSPAYTTTQETERSGVHSSSIFIDTTNPRRTTVQESMGDQSLSIHPHIYGGGGMHMMDPQGPSSMPPSRTLGPLSVSLSSQVSNPGPESRLQSSVSYNPGFYGGGSVMSVGGGRFAQEVSSRSPPRGDPTSMMNAMSLSPNLSAGGSSMYPAYQTSSSGAGVRHPQGMVYNPMSPAVLHRSPSLQHQCSTGSSTSRSNSMDSEHGSVHMAGGDFNPQHTPPLPHQQLPPQVHRVMPMAVPVLSPSSSQSSLSSESSTRDRDHGTPQRPRSGSMQEEAAYSQALLEHQRQRMHKLTEDIHQKRQLLEQLRQQVSEIEKPEVKTNTRTAFPSAEDIAGLCESNRRLQTDIQMYLNELDMYRNGQTPFSIIDPMEQQNFYKNMPTGPNDLRYNKTDRPRPSPPPPPVPPPRPPPPRPPQRINSNDLTQQVPPPDQGQITTGGGSADSEEGESWSCSACTFQNHPALKKCEMCEMPRMIAGS